MEMGRSNTTGDSGDSVDLRMNNTYVEGEKVFAFHNGNWYEAKVLYICLQIYTHLTFFVIIFFGFVCD